MRPINRYTEGLDASRLFWALATVATLGGALWLILKG